jgi:uncharacterized protein with PhoU and TrkA domain
MNMTEVTLQAIERAMPGAGRARVHVSLLATLEVQDVEKIEVCAPTGRYLTLLVFADSRVEKDQIRISGDDLKKLGIPWGGMVTARKKIPVNEMIKEKSATFIQEVGKEFTHLGEKLSAHTSELKKNTDEISREIQDRSKNLSEKVAHEITPIEEKFSTIEESTAKKIKDVSKGSNVPEYIKSALKRLKPSDAAKLKRILLQHDGSIKAITVTAATVDKRTISNLTLPPDITIAAILRSDNTLIVSNPDTLLHTDDVVYIVGKDEGIEYVVKLLEC